MLLIRSSYNKQLYKTRIHIRQGRKLRDDRTEHNLIFSRT